MKNSNIRFNIHYFDVIDNSNKAYWLGFIWCDGSMIVRQRKSYMEYCLKISLQSQDYKHLKKFNDCIDGDYEVHYYEYSKSAYNSNNKECRLSIYNTYFGIILYEKYRMIPNRNDWAQIIRSIPKVFYKDFIRGILDADGSFSKYIITENNKLKNKYNIQFGGNKQICRFIENVLIAENLISPMKRKLYKRHAEPERDGNFVTLLLSGKQNQRRILNWLYKDANIYLDRKYNKYLNIMEEEG